jgi:choice-of-anchor A domain-containing protein/uncharacterized repeat protein (TIGR01451 family)
MSTSGFMRAPRAIRISIAVAVAAAAGLTALVAPLDGRADATPSTCSYGTLTSNALGDATGWTEFIEINGQRSSDSEGSVAYGGTLNPGGPTFVVGGHLTGASPTDTTLVVAGAHGNLTLERGSAYVLGSTGVDFHNPSTPRYLGASPYNFATSFSYLRDLSTSWAAATPNGTAGPGVVSGSQLAFKLSGSNPDLNVITLTPSQVSQLNAIATGDNILYDVPAGSTTIINVPGVAASSIGGHLWTGPSSQANDSSMASYNGIIWNFPDATSLSVHAGSDWIGHILAPKAAISVASVGHMTGQVIAKSFTSQYETHLGYFPSSACVPGPPSTPGTSDVTVTKSASTATPHGGDTITYTLTAKNLGTADATGVVITDALPAGLTYVSSTSPCTFSAGVVSCSVETLVPNASASVQVTVTVNPIAGAGPTSHPQATHWMTPYHPESQVDLEAGQQKSVTLSCNNGDILSDGDFRVDHVDQGTGTFSDVKILSSRIDGLGLGTWKGVIRNDTTGRVQAKAFIACLPGKTEAADRQTGYNDSHKHDLLADAAPITASQSLVAGRTSVTLTCASGRVPVAPGYDLSSASAVLVGSETDYAHRTWTFTFDASAPVAVTVSARCLQTTTSSVYGHTHELRFTHVVNTVSVPGDTANEGNEFKVICPDDAKGISATFLLPPGVQHWGDDPRMKERAFRLFNQSGSAKNATIDLVCMHDRTKTEGMGTDEPVTVVNTASVTSTTSTDANNTNNSASATITVQPGSSTTGLVGSGRVSASAFSMRLVSSMPGKGALSVRSGGALLAQGSVTLKAGKSSTASLELTAAGKRQLGKLDKVTVKVDPTRGRTTTQSVTVRH